MVFARLETNASWYICVFETFKSWNESLLALNVCYFWCILWVWEGSQRFYLTVHCIVLKWVIWWWMNGWSGACYRAWTRVVMSGNCECRSRQVVWRKHIRKFAGKPKSTTELPNVRPRVSTVTWYKRTLKKRVCERDERWPYSCCGNSSDEERRFHGDFRVVPRGRVHCWGWQWWSVGSVS